MSISNNFYGKDVDLFKQSKAGLNSALGESMNPTILPPAIGKLGSWTLLWQTLIRFFYAKVNLPWETLQLYKVQKYMLTNILNK